jgi:hypothetical protein
VCGVGDEDLGAALTPVLEVRADHHDPGELALGAGRGLQADAVHAADLGQVALELVRQVQVALEQLHRLQRVRGGKSGQARDRLVELGVVLHRARAQRVEAQVH